MFELTVSTNKAKASDISFLMSFLKAPIKSIKGIIVSEEFDGRVKAAIAVPDESKDYAVSLVFDAISEVIIRDYKFEYFKNNIKLGLSNKVTETAFLKALSLYDKTADKEYIKKELWLSSEILIDSFYSFRLWELEKRWEMVASLISENAKFIFMSGSFTELLKFLILSTACETGEVHIHLGEGNIYCNEQSGRELFNMIYIDKDESSKINILLELISLAPEKIVIYKDLEKTELANDISNIFDGRVSIIKK